MKRLLAIMVACSLIMSLTACTGENKHQSVKKEPTIFKTEIEFGKDFEIDKHIVRLNFGDNANYFQRYSLYVDEEKVDLGASEFFYNECYSETPYYIRYNDSDLIFIAGGYDNDGGAQVLLKYENGSFKCIDEMRNSRYTFTDDGSLHVEDYVWCFGTHFFENDVKITDMGFKYKKEYFTCRVDANNGEGLENYLFAALQDVAVEKAYSCGTQKLLPQDEAVIKKDTKVCVLKVNEEANKVVFYAPDLDIEYTTTYELNWDYDYETDGPCSINGINESQLFGTQFSYAG